MKRNSARYIALLGMLVTISLMLSYVETLIPAIPIAGAKIGLPNVVTLIAICVFGFWEAFTITLIRTTISAFLFTSVSALAYSLVGGIFSLIVMYLLRKLLKDKISIMAVSITGALVHNMAQLVVAILVLETVSIAYLLPWLTVVAIPAGILVGTSAQFMLKHLNSLFKLETQ